jgi:hypothetical protein
MKTSQEFVLAAQFLDDAHCPGAHGLSPAAKARLEAVRDRGRGVAPH